METKLIDFITRVTQNHPYISLQKEILFGSDTFRVEKRIINKDGKLWYSGYYLNGNLVFSHQFYEDGQSYINHMFFPDGKYMATKKY